VNSKLFAALFMGACPTVAYTGRPLCSAMGMTMEMRPLGACWWEEVEDQIVLDKVVPRAHSASW